MASSSESGKENGGAILLYDESIFDDVPEGCIASIIASTTPTDACRLALVSRAFLSASESDIVWDRFLPSDYVLIVSRSDGGEALLTEFQNKKKQLYFRLADRSLLIDNASKSFQLEKSSGKKCWMISARSMSIIWGDTPSYWQWLSIRGIGSRFSEVAELISVCWLEICGRIQTSMLSPNTQYVAYLVFKLADVTYGLEEALEASVCNARGEISTRRVYLDANHEQQSEERGWFPRRLRFFNNNTGSASNHDQFGRQRTDGWQELKIGEFFVQPGEEDDEVELSVKEVNRLNWKRGLIVEGIEVRPV